MSKLISGKAILGAIGAVLMLFLMGFVSDYRGLRTEVYRLGRESSSILRWVGGVDRRLERIEDKLDKVLEDK